MSFPEPRWKKKQRRKNRLEILAKVVLVFIAFIVLMFGGHLYGAKGNIRTAIGTFTGECRIKGNISAMTGERIYHLPGQKYYPSTRINFIRGERWFCTEAQAQAAGWRKAKTL